MPEVTDLPKNIQAKIAVSKKTFHNGTGCWEWTGAAQQSRRSAGRYGRVKVDGQNQRTHRVVYSLLVGEIEAGQVLDHLCRNTICCNPDHLEPVTSKENTLRGIGPAAANSVKTHCIHGHEFSPENTYIGKQHGSDTSIMRKCRQCKRDRAARKARQKVL